MLSAAAALDRHCLFDTHTQAAALLKKSLRIQGRCIATERSGRGCNVARTADRVARFAETMTRKLNAACSDLRSLVAVTPADLVARTQAQAACLLATAHPTTAPFTATCGPRPEAAALPGVRYFLPARTTSTHTLLRSNTFMTSLTAGGTTMGAWLAGAVSDPAATPDRVDEGTLVSAIAGVSPFACPLPD